MQQKPDKAVPAESLKKAKAVILLDRTKAGFVFAYEGGSGVAMKKDAKSDQWSPVAFLNASDASLGFQVGGQKSFLVILLMNTNATRLLTDADFKLGGETRATGGNDSAGVSGSTSPHESDVLVYDDRKGLYAGVDFSVGSLAPDDHANQVYYSKFVTMRDILAEGKVQPTPAGKELAEKVKEYTKSVASK
jgi:lipid-binding SYLF domain-containing protein